MKYRYILSGLLAVVLLGTSHMFGQESKESPRKVLVRVPPEYPALLQSKGIGGRVKLRVVINPSGNVRSTELIGGNPILAVAAIDAVKKWHYERGESEAAIIVELNFDPH